MKCNKCGKEVTKLYNGHCIKCLNIDAVKEETERDSENYDECLQSDNPITIDDMRRLMELLDAQAKKDNTRTNQKKNGIEIAQEKLGINTPKEWFKIKPTLDRLLLKYAKEMCNCKYDIMMMDKFIALNDKKLILVENYEGIAVYYRDGE